MIEICDICQEDINRPIWIHEYISDEFIQLDKIQSLLKYKSSPIIGGYFRGQLNNMVLYYFKVVQSFYLAFKNVDHLRKEIGNNGQYIKESFDELYRNMQILETQLHSFNDIFPEMISSIKEKMASIIVLNTQKNCLRELKESGQINQGFYDEEETKYELRLRKLDSI